MRRFSLCPDAVAKIHGGEQAPCLKGSVKFYQLPGGVLVEAELTGLPSQPPSGFFAFHIHEGGSCEGPGFSQTGNHFNPKNEPHPLHAGDLPPLLENRGRAYLQVLTERFRVEEIVGRTVVIHSGPDDFSTQPSGNPGSKIACGVIRRL